MINFLEQLVAEWYEFRGYFVRRNVNVGRRANGGYDCELDVVAFDARSRHIVHLEPSMDSHAWEKRESRFRKKFEAGRKHIPSLFPGFPKHKKFEQIAVLVYGSARDRTTIGGGRLVMMNEFMSKIRADLTDRPIATAAVPEQFVILRSLQFAAAYWR